MNQKPKPILASFALAGGILSLLSFFLPPLYLPLAIFTLLCASFVIFKKKTGKERAKSAIVLVILAGILLALWFVICYLFMDINIFTL